VFEETSHSLDLASDCLEAYISRLHSSTESTQQACEQHQERKAGSRALLWFFELNEYANSTTWERLPRFMRSVTFLMVAEDSESYLWDWVVLKEAPPFGQGSSLSPFNVHVNAAGVQRIRLPKARTSHSPLQGSGCRAHCGRKPADW